jgi:hypothetical protein
LHSFGEETACANTSAALCKKSLVHLKCQKAKLQWKILWLWKVWDYSILNPFQA